MPPRDDTPLHELEFAVVDVETTGTLAAGGDRVTEVAAVTVCGGRVVESYSSLVRPGRPIPAFIVRLTGISEAMVATAPPFAAIAADLQARLEGRVFVAHNAPFDWAFIREELTRATGVVPDLPILCTVRLARRLLSHLPRRNLDAVTAHFGVTIDGRHRALGDARATAEVLVHLLDHLGRDGVHTWGDLTAWLRRPTRARRAMPSPVTDFRSA
jgi:DNA polymerase-3 subunit epsilon